ncbi:MAG: hypothetical protein NT175_11020 [Bacteroidetes bacterium]|nr:hypothetical protein [Bacteroidota bacterium]
MKKWLSITLASLLFVSSCDTSLDIMGNYEDITVVYGLLNQIDSVTYIKINKAFLGEGNALLMAREPDSSSYGNNIEVKIEEYDKYGGLANTFYFDTTSIYNKDTGTFYYPKQILYKCITKNQLNVESSYKLIIHNKKTGKDITARTLLVGDFEIVKPLINNPSKPTISFPDNNSLKEVEWTTAKYGRRYDVVMRFNFKEKLFNDPDTLLRYVDYHFTSQKSKTLDGGEEMLTQIANENFFKYLEATVPYDTEKELQVDCRVSGTVDFIFSVAGDDFNTYMEVNAPSTSIVQDRPEYTNVTNGIGIFSCRYNKIRKFFLNPVTVVVLVSKNIKFIKVIGG